MRLILVLYGKALAFFHNWINPQYFACEKKKNAYSVAEMHIYGLRPLNSVAGTSTAANAMIEAAGCRNAVTEYRGYKALTAEGAVAAAPGIILLTARGLESIGGIDKLLAFPGLAETPAGRARRVVTMDDLKLLGFGPRTGEAITELATQFVR